MSTSIKNVAVIGASGDAGVPIVRELLAQGFTVTALTRASSSSTFPAGVIIKKIDNFSSIDSLSAALKGQDAVVSTVATTAIADQKIAVDAAIATGVKRFIPSEFGRNTRNLETKGLGALLGDKAKVGDYLIEKSAQIDTFSWTGIGTGSFFDWSLDNGLYGFNKATRTATIYDSGNAKFQASTLALIGKAVAAVLSRPEETKNKYLEVASGNSTQNELLKILEQETGEKWKLEHVETAGLAKAGDAAIEKGQYSEAFVPYLLTYFFADGQDHALKPEQNANKLLGLEEDDLAAVLKAWLHSK